MNSPTPQNQSNDSDQDKPVGGAIIDEQGHEIEITEHMIQDACDELEKSRTGELNED
ncbi:PA1571 family protein [Pseudomonas sp. M30-35]|uniref:PA1571 family protein n=1 Tax=Pseudomonas sp. M30-35 TaxID=1981174 RepID=UPI0015AE7948|nr:PA1571 family protein [Pseudomonas sp. M30-35]